MLLSISVVDRVVDGSGGAAPVAVVPFGQWLGSSALANARSTVANGRVQPRTNELISRILALHTTEFPHTSARSACVTQTMGGDIARRVRQRVVGGNRRLRSCRASDHEPRRNSSPRSHRAGFCRQSEPYPAPSHDPKVARTQVYLDRARVLAATEHGAISVVPPRIGGGFSCVALHALAFTETLSSTTVGPTDDHGT